MGVTFISHSNGGHSFACRKCKTNLADDKRLISRNFTGTSGPAYLFDRVVNVTVSDEKRLTRMLTGDHIIRDVNCKKCKTRLGWFYEFTEVKSQMYKEGKIILERMFLKRDC